MGKYILGIGGANFDVHVKAFAQYNLHDSNPASFETSAGGVCRNIMENLARLGAECRMITAIGEDAFGDGIIKSMERAGIGTEGVYKSSDYSSSSYIDFLDGDGEMYVAACDAKILENLPLSWFEENKELIQGAAGVVIDANLTEVQIEKVLSLAGKVPVYADPVSTAKALRLKPFIGRFSMIKPNALELEALSEMSCQSDENIKKAAAELIEKGCKTVVVSLGSRGCYYADEETNFFAEPVRTIDMQNCTGAGDAFMAGFVFGLASGFNAEKSVKLAQSCGALAAESPETISKSISSKLLENI